MLGFHEKRKLKKIIYSKTVLVLLCIPVVFMIYAAYGAYEKKAITSAQRAELSAQLLALEKRAAYLEEDIEMLGDSRGIEMELRSRYEVGREGEEVVVFIEEKATTTKPAEYTEEQSGFLKRMMSKLF